MSESPSPVHAAVCGICGERIEQRQDAVVTATSVLHVSCVEQSAAAA